MTRTAHICKCSLGWLHLTGDTCEFCMGEVRNGLPWPEVDAYLAQGEFDPFDELYFEELEAMFDDIDYAA